MRNIYCIVYSRLLSGIPLTIGDASVSAVPITVADLEEIYSILNMSVAFWLSLIIGFRGLLSKSNLFEKDMALRVMDLRRESWGVLLSLQRTKNISFKERVLEIPLVSIPNSIFCVECYSGCLLALVNHPSAFSHLLFHHQISTCIENVKFREVTMDLLPGTIAEVGK